jgi:hypothetical protein
MQSKQAASPDPCMQGEYPAPNRMTAALKFVAFLVGYLLLKLQASFLQDAAMGQPSKIRASPSNV